MNFDAFVSSTFSDFTDVNPCVKMFESSRNPLIVVSLTCEYESVRLDLGTDEIGIHWLGGLSFLIDALAVKGLTFNFIFCNHRL